MAVNGLSPWARGSHVPWLVAEAIGPTAVLADRCRRAKETSRDNRRGERRYNPHMPTHARGVAVGIGFSKAHRPRDGPGTRLLGDGVESRVPQ